MTGGACSDVVPFFGYVWVDDPVLVKPDTPPRLHCAEEAIRLAMLAVLCPRAINEEKLSEGLSPWLTGELAQDSEQLIKFAMWCWWPRPGSRGNSASTVVSKLSHISWYHRRYCGFSVGLHAGHQVAMQRMQRLSAPPSRKRSITVDLLRPLRARCDFQSAHDRVLWGGGCGHGLL
ncbi:hypothetical protein PC116_g20342 [Phytophthora cactorum]|uniref:Uncharacterized protein n=1 Tax=Phytophthora cactorum TaxID=29920 RepID=A0A329SSK9_9STRA|nr:hypothetical protein PC123_g23485 [Phytophthora cactorum]KAG4231386.1 hypothetical protein PC116_g20342 [Phytophthora cactorum]RAW39639.1 hypothetical protein PC110_g4169 [Phytophthora cactorum]